MALHTTPTSLEAAASTLWTRLTVVEMQYVVYKKPRKRLSSKSMQHNFEKHGLANALSISPVVTAIHH